MKKFTHAAVSLASLLLISPAIGAPRGASPTIEKPEIEPNVMAYTYDGTKITNSIATHDLLRVWGPDGAESDQTIELFRSIVKGFQDAGEDSRYPDMMKQQKVQAMLTKHNREVLAGPMLGDVTPKSIKVWLRTLSPAEVTVKIGKRSFSAQSSVESDLTAVVAVTGLKAQTEYEYSIFVDGKEIKIADIEQKFHTPMAAGGAPEGRIIFGSCFHRWGLGNAIQAKSIMDRDPDALLFNGDIAVQDKGGNAKSHRVDYTFRDFSTPWRKMVASYPVYATWDDHDYIGNDQSGIPTLTKGTFTAKDRDELWDVFKYAWCNPYYGNGKAGVYHHATIGAADVIMVDNRYFRDNANRKAKNSFLGEEQMEWLKRELLACKSPFKILSCGTMWSDYVSSGKDSWGTWDKEGREEIYKLIVDNNISGVLLISGDRHGARGFGVPLNDEFMLYEFGGASLGGRHGAESKNSSWTTQLYGISLKYAFSEFTFGGTKKSPEVTFRLLSDRGEIIYDRCFTQSELTPKK